MWHTVKWIIVCNDNLQNTSEVQILALACDPFDLPHPILPFNSFLREMLLLHSAEGRVDGRGREEDSQTERQREHVWQGWWYRSRSVAYILVYPTIHLSTLHSTCIRQSRLIRHSFIHHPTIYHCWLYITSFSRSWQISNSRLRYCYDRPARGLNWLNYAHG